MPRRILEYSRTEPARTVLFVVSLLSGLAQMATLTPWVPPSLLIAIPNVVIVVPVCLWGLVSAYKNNAKHMAMSSFGLFMLWAWSGVMRMILAADPTNLLWVPFMILAAVMGIVYLYLSYQRRLGDLD